MMADPLLTVPIHRLGQYAFPRIQKPKDVIPAELDNDDDNVMNSYEDWIKQLSDRKMWQDSGYKNHCKKTDRRISYLATKPVLFSAVT